MGSGARAPTAPAAIYRTTFAMAGDCRLLRSRYRRLPLPWPAFCLRFGTRNLTPSTSVLRHRSTATTDARAACKTKHSGSGRHNVSGQEASVCSALGGQGTQEKKELGSCSQRARIVSAATVSQAHVWAPETATPLHSSASASGQ